MPLPACPCHSSQPYADCCAPFHAGAAAPDARRLMRSRYAAFALRLPEYLLATWHASTRPPSIDFDDAQEWIGLDVRRYLPLDASHAVVEFVARYRAGGRVQRMHETSRFVREDGRWYYVDGDVS